MMPPDHGSPGSGYGSDADSREYLRKNARRRGQLLKQFTKLESGLGNSDAFRDGWVQAFGKHICGACGLRFEWASEAMRHAAEHLGDYADPGASARRFWEMALARREAMIDSGIRAIQIGIWTDGT